MKSAVAVIGALCCGASSAGAFVVSPGRPSGSSVASSAVRRSHVRRISSPSMSSVATPTTASVAPTQEPERRSKIQVRDAKEGRERPGCCSVDVHSRALAASIGHVVFYSLRKKRARVCVHQNTLDVYLSILATHQKRLRYFSRSYTAGEPLPR